MPDASRRRSLAGRLLITYAVTVIIVLGVLGFFVERAAGEALLDEVALAAFRSRLAAVVALAGVLGVLVVGVVARRLARPITQLADAASAVAAGDLEVPLPRSPIEEFDRLGQAVGAMATELRTHFDEVEGERRTLGVVLDALPQGTLLVGHDDRILYANQSFGLLLGPVPDQLDKVVPFRIQEMVRRSRRSDGVVDQDVEHGRPARILRVIVSPLDNLRVLVVVGDITERRLVDDVRRDFVTNASHELKTPVASILASAETLQIALDRSPDKAPQFARQIEKSAQALSRLVTDLLDLSRLEGKTLEFEPLSLAEVVATELAAITDLARRRDVTMHLVSEPVTVFGSAPDLALAVRNLLGNAIRYTEAGGEVVVTVAELEGWASLSVTDTGTGISQRDLDRIFERFYRVDIARSRATGGTGLGLSIVRHVVDAHGGNVSVESQLGSGSTFTVRIPSS